jgi:hypothetical protein
MEAREFPGIPFLLKWENANQFTSELLRHPEIS